MLMTQTNRIPFKELKACPQCGSRELEKTHSSRGAGKGGIYTFVIYRCPNGHETRISQLDTLKNKSAWNK